jgi:hypothetical protein
MGSTFSTPVVHVAHVGWAADSSQGWPSMNQGIMHDTTVGQHMCDMLNIPRRGVWVKRSDLKQGLDKDKFSQVMCFSGPEDVAHLAQLEFTVEHLSDTVNRLQALQPAQPVVALPVPSF